MSGVLAIIGTLVALGLIALAIWMMLRVPDPKHAMMIDMLSDMQDTAKDVDSQPDPPVHKLRPSA